MIDFVRLVKGQVAQTLVRVFLERVGYRVTRFGVEDLVDEVKGLSFENYQSLGLPDALRALPDLLVADRGLARACLVEVKYRRTVNERSARALHSKIPEQARSWPGTNTVVLIADSLWNDRGYIQDHFRLVPAGEEDRLLEQRHSWRDVWDRLPMVQTLFTRMNDDVTSYVDGDAIVPAIRALANVERVAPIGFG